MSDKNLILKAIRILIESARQHKLSLAAHRKQAKECMVEANELKQSLMKGEE